MSTEKHNHQYCEKGGSNASRPIHRIPSEVWEHIFESLEDSRDLVSVSRANPFWNDILYPTKQAWLFVQVFPLLMKDLSKADILRCRQVCKNWCQGVDHFLEQNAFHRPASSQERDRLEEENTNHYKTDNRILPIIMLFGNKKLLYKKLKVENMVALLNEHANTKSSVSRNPFIGRSVAIVEDPVIHIPSNLIFLEQFGKHIWFLNVSFVNLKCADVVKRLLAMLQLLPNLKKLDLDCANSPQFPQKAMFEGQEKRLAQYINNGISDKIRKSLPKLETLEVQTTVHVQIKQILLSLFFNNNLESLAMGHMPILPSENCVAFRLVDLYMSLSNDDEWITLDSLNCPLRRLVIDIGSDVSWMRMIESVNRYHSSLRNLRLQFSANSHDGAPSPLGALKLPQLLRLSLRGHLPPSLNFIVGLKSVEYLYLHMNSGMQQWRNPMDWARCQRKYEILDVITKYLCDIGNYGNVAPTFVYESNVWLVFPKLKVLTLAFDIVASQQLPKEWEFRRDIYEQIQADEMSLC